MVKTPVLFNKTLVIGITILFIGISVTPIINGNIWIRNTISSSKIIEEKIITKSLPNKTNDENQTYFGSYPTNNEFVLFYHPPRELEWEYNNEGFNGIINEFNILASDNSNHSWNLSRFELHINGVNCSTPDTQSFYRRIGAWYQWEITWDNLNQTCNGEILFEIIFLDCLWVQTAGDLDEDGDATFHYSYYNPYSWINGTLDGDHIFDNDKPYIVWYTPFGEPPDAPSEPSGNTSGYICINHSYSTSTSDPYGLNVTYGWDWNGDLIVDEWTDWYESNETCTLAHNWSDPGDYNIGVKAKNTLEKESNWSSQLSITMLNHPPNAPREPTPLDGASNVPVDGILCWIGGDPDICDTLSYDVFFSTSYPPKLVVQNQTEECFDPYGSGDLPFFEEFYWRVIARDNHGARNSSPVWTFKTGINSPPTDPKIDGPNPGDAGVDYNFTFVSKDPDNNTIKYFINWSDGITTDTGLYASGEVVTLNHSFNEKGEYIIKAIAEDSFGAQSNESTFKINIPRYKAVNFNINLLSCLFERFPFLEVFLRAINLLR